MVEPIDRKYIDDDVVYKTLFQQSEDDTISRQATIDEWKNDFKGYVNELDIPRDDYNGIMAYIDEMPSARAEPRWIPVEDKERLPRDGQRVLITDEDGEIEVACIVDYSDIGEDIEWWSHDYPCHPIAWSELPKPYERSEDE